MKKRLGQQSIVFEHRPMIISCANIAGPMEGEGLRKDDLDIVLADNLQGYDSWEQCESYMLTQVIEKATKKSELEMKNVEFVLAGDLLNQLMSTHFAMRTLKKPFLGLYGACSTMIESMIVGGMMVDGQFAECLACAASSHHDAAERQYRYPTELGIQRPPSAQWTVTGAGAAILSMHGVGPMLKGATIGKVIDMGIKDPNALGSAMAPAAVDTLVTHFKDFNCQPSSYDMIFTGDLGIIGKKIVVSLCREKGFDLEKNYQDCGCLIYKEEQDAHAGASGCASSAIVFCGYIYKMLQQGKWKKILLVGTGSLHSPTSYQQKESIPCIAHAISIES